MPSLILFAVCEKVIIDRREVPSLINVFQRMDVQVSDAPLPENAIAPVRWDVLSIWSNSEDDIGKKFHQRVEVIKPDGQKFGEVAVDFECKSAAELQSRNAFQFFGVPIKDEGTIRVLTWLGDNDTPAGEYAFEVKHVRQERHNE